MRLPTVLKNATLFLSLLSFPFISNSQSLNPPTIESPNAASLGSFGEVPVNMFTGTPNISVPLYTLKYGKISVPISLRYNSAAVKPGQQPSWVGSGWDLESIGSITRQARGIIDEEYTYLDINNGVNNLSFYYPYTGEAVSSGSSYANLTNWNNPTQLLNDFITPVSGGPLPPADVQADEFSFNVLGHSGKFYYEASGWQVVSDEHIIVQMTDMFSPNDVYNGINQYVKNYAPSSSAEIWPDQSRCFGSFTLIMSDGTKFVFGGRDGQSYPTGVEFSSPIPPIGTNSQDQAFTANTWLLTSITDIYGNTINFSYARTYPTCNIDLNANFYSGQVVVSGGGLPCQGQFGTPYNLYPGLANNLSGTFIWPMYLSQVSSGNENIKFNFSPQQYNRYPVTLMSQADLSNTSALRDISVLGIGNSTQNLQNVQWEQLNSMVITDDNRNPQVNSGQPNIIKQYQFNYLNTGNTNQRLMLGSLGLLDNQGRTIGQYSFSYNVDLSAQNISLGNTSLFSTGNFSDHWGYYNGTDVTVSPVNIYNGKQPNPGVVTSELLSQLTYPTGGYTKFTWQPSDYSQVVPTTNARQPLQSWHSFSNLTGYGGGSRIFEIENFLADGAVATDKKYYYKSGYLAGVDPSTLSSSGVLNGIPQYDFSITRTGVASNETVSLGLSTLYGTGNYGYTGQGSPVGYKEVDEVNPDGSYTKNIFTSYDADLNNVSHYDIAPTGYIGWLDGDTYFPYTSLELERGKPIGIFIYTSNNVLLKKTIITYRNDPGRAGSTINLIDCLGSYASSVCPYAGITFATARSVYTYSYYPINKTVTTYDQQGNNPVAESTDYTYNVYNLIQTSTATGSQGEKIKHTYSYATDYTDQVSVWMAKANILTPIIQDAMTYQAAGSGSPVLPTKVTYTPYYSPATGIYVPQNTQIQVAGNPNEVREQFYQYDPHGNIQELSKTGDEHDVYLWGYNSQYVVAKIINSTYSAVQTAMSQAGITQSQLDNVSIGLNDDQMRSLLNGLRSYLGPEGAFVTTYTYACGIGMTSQTDPNNRTTYYDYDPMGRLFDIRDQDKNVIKKFCYDYSGQQEVCNVYYNAQQSGTFTQTNCSAYTSPATVTYTVPAGKYSAYTLGQANQLAINDVNTNGPAYANANGICSPWVSMPVSMGSGGANPQWIIEVEFFQGSTLVSSFTFNNAGGTVYAPAGTYTVVVTQTNNYSRTVTLGQYGSQTGTSVTFNNVVMSGCCFNGVLSVN